MLIRKFWNTGVSFHKQGFFYSFEIPCFAYFGLEKQKCLFKKKFGGHSNSNMVNSTVVLICHLLD